ncbi:hypothetical protein [Nocardia asteroides]|uniref:hypothetical protein n=1 Tax=Nocardia asteroides TaxID=1824 RepID=UPI001E2F644B|nr:hypothetical protein [Nocardia asteroides]UGT60135.1 hypothetical protein LTT61_23385 [Nocardia asteroides]
MASTSLPLATAAAVATFFAAPAGAVPNDQPSTPATPAPVQPGTNATPEQQPQTQQQGPTQPGTGPQSQQPQTPESKPTPSQPGVTTPEQDQALPEKTDPKLNRPTQPGVTTPRVAPLPVPGQEGQPAPGQPAPGAAAPDQAPGAQDQPAGTPSAPGAAPQASPGTAPQSGGQADSAPSQTLVQPRYEAPRVDAAPAAPVVEMTGPHAEIGAAIDGGALLPGYVANTHHFSNEAGYVGTVGYNTPTGSGEAGVSVEFVDSNTIHVSSFTGGEGLADAKSSVVLDTTQVNLAKAAVEDWIKAQPGGAAALDAAAQVKLPPIVPPGDTAPTTVDVGGVTTQWGGSLQY